jgi:tetratricopeptide (TPR) repeat protein
VGFLALTLIIAATRNSQTRQAADPWRARIDAITKGDKEARTLLRNNYPGKSLTADEAAGDTYLMRYRGGLASFGADPGYADLRRTMVAAELINDPDRRIAEFQRIAAAATSPIVRHRCLVEVASSALRSGDPARLGVAIEAAEASLAAAGKIGRAAEADSLLLAAEAFHRQGDHRKALSSVNKAIDADPAFLSAHFLRLTLVDRVSGIAEPREARRLLELGVQSADFIRVLKDQSYVIDARDTWLSGDSSAITRFLRVYLGSLGGSREASLAEAKDLHAKCGGLPNCSSELLSYLRRIINSLEGR